MRDNEILFAQVVGYMLKILKNKIDITKFHNEFAAIRHGDYDTFISLVKEPIPWMMTWENGAIENNIISVKDKCDFVGLIASKPSLEKFYRDCYKQYGKVKDTDFANEIYQKLAVFEARIRMHVRNHNLIEDTDTLATIIDKLPTIYPLTKKETKKIHDGRKFLNKIKHHKITSTTWKQNVSLFEEAYDLLDKTKIQIFG